MKELVLPQRVYNLTQTAKILNISYHSLRALIDAGAIRPIFLPKEKVTDIEIEKFLNEIQKNGSKYRKLLEDNNKRLSGSKSKEERAGIVSIHKMGV